MLRTLLGRFLSERGYDVRLAKDAADATRVAAEFPPEVALLDVHLGTGPSGLDLSIALSHLFPRIAVVFLTNVADPRVMGHREAQLPKGYQYVLKSRLGSADDLVAIVEAAVKGRSETAVRDNLRSDSPMSELSDSQIQVLRMVAGGASNRQIAMERGTTERAVESLIQRAATALDLRTSSDGNLRVQIAMTYLRALGLATHA